MGLDEFKRLEKLEFLDLSGNQLSGSLSFKELKLENLKVLNLEYTNFNKLSDVEALTSLKALSLNDIGINDSSVLQGICSLKNLHELDLSRNNFYGPVPMCFRNLTSLRLLDLSNNILSGNIPAALITPLVHLEYLSLSGNLFGGSFSFSSLGNHSKLQGFKLGPLNNDSHVDTEDLALPPPFQLKALYLSGCNLNNQTRKIPSFLLYQKEMQNLDLSSNKLVGQIPTWLLQNNTNLEVLVLKDNSFTGPFLVDDSLGKYLRQLDISNNDVSGKVPQNIGLSFSSLQWLNLSGNSFEANIPQSLGNLTWAESIDLSHNTFSGEVLTYAICKLSDLEFLDLSKNQLIGPLPACSELTSLKFIHLHHNMISGPISNMLSGSFNLMTLDLGYNKLSGGIPPLKTCCGTNQLILPIAGNLGFFESDYSSCSQINREPLAEMVGAEQDPQCRHVNHFSEAHGNRPVKIIPTQVKFMEILQTANSCPKTKFIVRFSYSNKNVIFTTKSRSERYAGNILNFMSGLDLSCNQLIGAIPPEFGDLRHIRALNLSHNYLQGSIPSRLSMLNLVESLDLSYNNFSGEIPSELASLNFLSIFNVSYNNLSGRVPDTGEFATFDDSNYRGNPGLCGPLLKRSCNPFAPHPENVGDQDIEVDGAIDVAAFYWSFFASYMVIVISFVVILCVSPYYRRAWSFYIDYWILSRFYEYCGSRSSEKKQTWKVFNWNMRRR
ncbi:unnamed protein product [Coffea canephora]|uniref:Leucine-rich repeat-containing N-terminal plant-type domain-containing protein n=1 Tax=Coffea canephora TaxID=49390 RepID=A0A068VDB9_COFCA|nr:unnamed protein product [Coffea canephora]